MSSSPYFAGSQALPNSQLPNSPRKGCGSKISPNVNEEEAHDLSMVWYVHKSMWPDEIHLRVLRERVDVDGNPLYHVQRIMAVRVNPM